MTRLRHLAGLLRELGGYAVTNRAWWIVPFVLLLLVLTLLIVVGQAAAPFTIYPLF